MEREFESLLESIVSFVSSLPASFTFWFWVGFFLYIISGLVVLANELDNVFRYIVRLGTWIAIFLSIAILLNSFGWDEKIFGSSFPTVFPWGASVILFILIVCILFGQIYLNNGDDPRKEMELYSNQSS